MMLVFSFADTRDRKMCSSKIWAGHQPEDHLAEALRNHRIIKDTLQELENSGDDTAYVPIAKILRLQEMTPACVRTTHWQNRIRARNTMASPHAFA